MVSASLQRYVYVFAKPIPDSRLEITSSDYQQFFSRDPEEDMVIDGDLRIVKAVLDFFEISRNLSIFVASEVPPGTGLGSSSSLTVALVKAISTLLAKQYSKADIAKIACEIEIEKLGASIGKQDQYAASFGGINQISFSAQSIDVMPLQLELKTQIGLASNLSLYYTGRSHSSEDILYGQANRARSNEADISNRLKTLKNHAERAAELLLKSDLDGYGALLHESWLIKRGISDNITNDFIDECYERALDAGAIGGKITGAGSGGFLLVYAPKEAHSRVSASLKEMGLHRMACSFDHAGALVLVNAGRLLV